MFASQIARFAKAKSAASAPQIWRNFASVSSAPASICDHPFLKKWNKLSLQEQEVVRREWRQKETQSDWKSLTLEEKQACKW